MKKTFKFAFLGATVGVGYVVAKSSSSDGSANPEGETSAATVVGGLTVTGAAVGFLLDRRARRRNRRRSAMEALKAGDLVFAAKAAKPFIESAVEAAKPKVEHAIEVARPKLEHAAEATRDAAAAAAVKARPHVEHAREVASAKVDEGVRRAKERARQIEANGHRPAVLVNV